MSSIAKSSKIIRKARQSVQIEPSCRIVLNRVLPENYQNLIRRNSIGGPSIFTKDLLPLPTARSIDSRNRQSLPLPNLNSLNAGQVEDATPSHNAELQHVIEDVVSTVKITLQRTLNQEIAANATRIRYQMKERYEQEIFQLKGEMADMERKYKLKVAEAKKKQWCSSCGTGKRSTMNFYCNRNCEKEYM